MNGPFADCDESPRAGPLVSKLLATIVSATRISPAMRIMSCHGSVGDFFAPGMYDERYRDLEIVPRKGIADRHFGSRKEISASAKA